MDTENREVEPERNPRIIAKWVTLGLSPFLAVIVAVVILKYAPHAEKTQDPTKLDVLKEEIARYNSKTRACDTCAEGTGAKVTRIGPTLSSGHIIMDSLKTWKGNDWYKLIRPLDSIYPFISGDSVVWAVEMQVNTHWKWEVMSPYISPPTMAFIDFIKGKTLDSIHHPQLLNIAQLYADFIYYELNGKTWFKNIGSDTLDDDIAPGNVLPFDSAMPRLQRLALEKD